MSVILEHESLLDFIRKYKDLAEKMGDIIVSFSERIELTSEDIEAIHEIRVDLKSLTYYAKKHDNFFKKKQ